MHILPSKCTKPSWSSVPASEVVVNLEASLRVPMVQVRRSVPQSQDVSLEAFSSATGWSNMGFDRPTCCAGHCCTNCCASQCFCWRGLSSRNKHHRRGLRAISFWMVPLPWQFRNDQSAHTHGGHRAQWLAVSAAVLA